MTYATANKERCVVLARYLVENKATVRAVAAKFGISKSTVHKDITQALRHVNPALYEEVKGILEVNKQERHLRGGEATKKKYHQKMAHTEG
jgi:putative DeoR family transcriptional regulator (stage III sporulation protein D)